MNRLQVGTNNRTEADLKEVRDFMHLIKAPHGNSNDILIFWPDSISCIIYN